MIQNVLKLLGLPHADPVVTQLMTDVGLGGAKIKLKRGESQVAFESEASGLDFNFSDPTAVVCELPRTEGMLVLSAVFLYAKGVQGHKQYAGTLPHDLQFEMLRKDVRKLLGDPVWSSPVMPIDRWSLGAHELTVWFTRPNETIGHVIAHLPKA